ncbi:MAG TPA: PIN domain-containing protein [Calditrichia bacterium]|nr:PIN domain-containing protein [Calditrichia bacterium]
MSFLLDTVTIIRHFSQQGRMGQKAAKALKRIDDGQDNAFISVISLMEILYLAERNRIDIHFEETLDLIERSSNYFIVDLTPQILTVAKTVEFPELHDRLILATAKFLDIPVVSSDRLFDQIPGISVLWD